MRLILGLVFSHLLLLVACSPSMNWRLLTLDEAKIEVMLPCRFEKAEQYINIKGETKPLNVYGCKVDDELFAVSILPFAETDTYVTSVEAWQFSLFRKTIEGALNGDGGDQSRNLWLQLKSNQRVDVDIQSKKIQLERNSKKVNSAWENEQVDELSMSFSDKDKKIKWKGIWGVRNVDGKKFLLHAIVIGNNSSQKDSDEFFRSVIN